MTPSRLMATANRWYQTNLGKRFGRFVPVAVAALLATQLTLTLLLGVGHVTSGTSGVLAAMVGAAVSYVLSRWAWERKGRPDLLRETLPFWAVSVGAWIVLGLASHLGSAWALSMGLDRDAWQRVLFVDGVYFVANCATFASRFLIFHFVLFKDREPAAPHSLAEMPAPHHESGSHLDDQVNVPGLKKFAVSHAAVGVNGANGNGSVHLSSNGSADRSADGSPASGESKFGDTDSGARP
ncbi:MAG TPA: hypothetical protein VGS19_28075 [Streptosporangiaceae bacterium]|nr:hypothetical protein [Streptosporangiaceae bacterium]